MYYIKICILLSDNKPVCADLKKEKKKQQQETKQILIFINLQMKPVRINGTVTPSLWIYVMTFLFIPPPIFLCHSISLFLLSFNIFSSSVTCSEHIYSIKYFIQDRSAPYISWCKTLVDKDNIKIKIVYIWTYIYMYADRAFLEMKLCILIFYLHESSLVFWCH